VLVLTFLPMLRAIRFHGFRFVSSLFLLALVGSSGLAQGGAPSKKPSQTAYDVPIRETYLQIALETDAMLHRDVLDVWFPRTVDNENGGFYSAFSREWHRQPSQGKFSVFQGRMTWIASQVAMRRPELKAKYLAIAEHGVEFLNNVLWDKQFGGFFWGLDDHGQITDSFGDHKEMYGESFALYGAAAAYQATHDPKALALAQNEFRWMEAHAHDSRNGGYFELLTREGKPVEAEPVDPVKRGRPDGGFPAGYKSMNTHIHLLESVSQLYEVWKDDTVRKRLEEMLAIVRDKICVEPGVMNLYFTNEWRPIPDHDSYGHDVETAYLMLEAEDVLGVPHDPKTERRARMLVDHALAYGWDDKLGGFYEHGTTFGEVEDKRKVWWVEMEGLNALLLMHERYGRQTDIYFKAFQQQWNFIKTYQVDSEFHGIYPSIGPDGVALEKDKGQNWKAAYHDGRALLNVTDRLNRLAGK
jgi:cellobiose epimerase